MRAIRQLLIRASRSGAVALSLANAAATATGVITSVIAARALGPAGRGDLAVLLLWPSLITSLFDSGLTDAVTSRTARGRGTWWEGILSAGVLGAVGVLGGVAAVHLALTPAQAHLTNPALWALAFIPLSLSSCVPLGTLAGSGRFRTLAAVRVGSAVVYLALLATLAVRGAATVATVLSLTVATRAIPLIVSVASSLRSRAGPVAPRAVPELLRSAAGFQLPRAATVLACNVDRVAAAWMLSQTDIGYWQVAVSLGTVVPFVGQAIAQELFATGSRGAGEPLPVVRLHVRRAVAATALFAGVGVAAAPVVIPAVFGQAFRESTFPAALAIIAAVPSAASFVLQAAMKARGLIFGAALSEALGASVVVVVALLSVPSMGLVGLAAGVALGRTASAAASYYGLHTSTRSKEPSVTVGPT